MDPNIQYGEALQRQQLLLTAAWNHAAYPSQPKGQLRGWVAQRLHRIANRLQTPTPRCELDVLRAVSRGELSVDQALPMLNGN